MVKPAPQRAKRATWSSVTPAPQRGKRATWSSVTPAPQRAKRATWLSVTPEPERELPEAVATLTAGHRPMGQSVEAERQRIERLILHGTQRGWLAYLHNVVDLIEQRTGTRDPDVDKARSRAGVVIANHHNLLLAHPGPGARLTADDRARLQELVTAQGVEVEADDHGHPYERQTHRQEQVR
jgi:hypothetical protein